MKRDYAWNFFFLQAEDGIRGVAVTGVQTCALPISGSKSTKGWWRKASAPSRPRGWPTRSRSSTPTPSTSTCGPPTWSRSTWRPPPWTCSARTWRRGGGGGALGLGGGRQDAASQLSQLCFPFVDFPLEHGDPLLALLHRDVGVEVRRRRRLLGGGGLPCRRGGFFRLLDRGAHHVHAPAAFQPLEVFVRPYLAGGLFFYLLGDPGAVGHGLGADGRGNQGQGQEQGPRGEKRKNQRSPFHAADSTARSPGRQARGSYRCRRRWWC